jgi:hypothetical protein
MWLDPSFPHPTRVDLSTGQHLRPIREADVDIDHPAVMASQARLFSIFGAAWGWPPVDMSYEHDRADLARHEAEMEARQSYNYAVLDADESTVLGCIYIDPPMKVGADAEVCWWVGDDLVGSELEAHLDEFVPTWLADVWPFERVRIIGRDVSWTEWLDLPAADRAVGS